MNPSPQIITTSSFTADNKIQEMENDNYKNTFTYGPSGERFKVNPAEWYLQFRPE